MSLSAKLDKWAEQGLISVAQAEKIKETEKQKGRGRIFYALGGIGALSIIMGLLSLVAANWHLTGPHTKIIGHLILNLGLAGIIFFKMPKPTWLREILVAILAGLFMTFIALTGQILQTQAPLWKPVGVWLVLATPLLFILARSFWVAKGWLALVVAFLFLLLKDFGGDETVQIICVVALFGLYALSQINAFRKILPTWAESWEKAFWVTVVLLTTLAQVLWHIPSDEITSSGLLPTTAMLTSSGASVVLLLLNYTKRNEGLSFWRGEKKEGDFALVVSLILTLLPLLIPHGKTEALGAIFFCIYWFFLGVLGLRLNNDRLWSAAMLLISARIFIAYIEIFGSLALQGIGFILSGLLLIGLALGTRRIMRQKPEWLIDLIGKE